VVDLAKTVHALDRAATVIGKCKATTTYKSFRRKSDVPAITLEFATISLGNILIRQLTVSYSRNQLEAKVFKKQNLADKIIPFPEGKCLTHPKGLTFLYVSRLYSS
jgi:hypothetical protein